MNEPRPVSEVSQLKALTHPLRVRILYALRAEGKATASRLGQLVDESPASVSYHLRKLSDGGFVVEAAGAGSDGRERWWTVPPEGFSWTPTDFADTPEGAAASRAAKQVLVDNQFFRQREYDASAKSWGDVWNHAALSCDFVMKLTAAETEAMMKEVQSVFNRWRVHSDERTDAVPSPADTEHVMVFAHGFPYRP
ncbi:ArsR/SmtB family transcription factor [Rhodococcus sp. NPDC057297]|uniref:ArsR/SmtB family transcription factor n=1 Tax=Rhodococcus sp. NPDC057297 TaxID=3346090 RepID=UPI00362F1C6E